MATKPMAVGQTVILQFKNGYQQLVERPAIIVRIWSSGTYGGTVQLQVFTDGQNDGPGCETGIVWKTSVQHIMDAQEHWPEAEYGWRHLDEPSALPQMKE